MPGTYLVARFNILDRIREVLTGIGGVQIAGAENRLMRHLVVVKRGNLRVCRSVSHRRLNPRREFTLRQLYFG